MKLYVSKIYVVHISSNKEKNKQEKRFNPSRNTIIEIWLSYNEFTKFGNENLDPNI